MSFLTGKPAKSTSTSSSQNQAYPFLQQQYGGQTETGVGANNALAALLGLGGDVDGATGGYDQFLKLSGFDNAMNLGTRGITGSAAANGLLRSGATAKGLQTNAANLGSNYFNQYLQQLLGLSGQGLQAGNLIGGAGGVSNSTGVNTGGGGGLLNSIGALGQGIGGFATLSDRRLKRKIVLLGRFPNGLGLYSYKYKWGFVTNIGVMAQEVQELIPAALGPKILGFLTVNYKVLAAEITLAFKSK